MSDRHRSHLWSVIKKTLLQASVRRLLRSRMQRMQQAIEYFSWQSQHPHELRKRQLLLLYKSAGRIWKCHLAGMCCSERLLVDLAGVLHGRTVRSPHARTDGGRASQDARSRKFVQLCDAVGGYRKMLRASIGLSEESARPQEAPPRRQHFLRRSRAFG